MNNKSICHGDKIRFPSAYNTLAEMLVYIADQYPSHGMTFIDIKGEETFLSYPELVSQAKQRILSILNRGLQSGDPTILIINHNLQDFYVTFWACIFAGIVVAPLSQPSFESGSVSLLKLKNVLEVLGKPTILIEEKYIKYFAEIQNTHSFSNLKFISTKSLNNLQGEGEIYSGCCDDLAVLQFSSGSTGTPKGVKLTNKNIITNLLAIQKSFGLTSDDNVFTWLPHTHDMGLFLQYLSSVIIGANIFLLSPMTFSRSPYLFLKKVSDHKATWFGSPNFGLDWMVKNITDEQVKTLDLAALKFILNGAEPISNDVITKFVSKFKQCGFDASKMRPAYGMAEVTVCATVCNLAQSPQIEIVDRKKLINDAIVIPVGCNQSGAEFIHVGYPLGSISVRVADTMGNTVTDYTVGEIQLQGDSMTSGYYNRPDINDDMFTDGWLHTGDLGFMVNGSLVITGRTKDIIFVRGQNYFAHDIENMVFATDVVQRGNLLITGLYNTVTQQEELLVFVRFRADTEKFLPLRKEIMHILHTKFALTTTHVIPIKNIPKTTSGKLQRSVVQIAYQNCEYEQIINELASCLSQVNNNDSASTSNSVTNLEDKLREIWAKILGIDEKNIGLDDSFLTLGGNSLLAFQLLNELSIYLNTEVDLEILTACKTIRQTIQFLQNESHASADNNVIVLRQYNSINKETAIAITGLAVKFPSANTQHEFWENLFLQKDGIKKISTERKKLSQSDEWDDWLGQIDKIDLFDNTFFNISAEEAKFIDPQQRLILEIAYQALEDAGMTPLIGQGHEIAVYSGVSFNAYYELILDYINKNGYDSIHPYALAGNLNNMISARLSNMFHFTGPSLAIDTACSSYSVALHHAITVLKDRAIKGVLVAGSNIVTTPTMQRLSRKAGILSTSSRVKVFGKDADGSVLGEGVVVLFLERLADAIKGDKQIYGVIRGSAINNDGESFSVMTPNPVGQSQVLQQAYTNAKINPSDLNYIEVHGTGTVIGDPIEVNTLAKVFSSDKVKHPIGIGSVKSNIGHLLAASGGAGLAKVLLCLKHKKWVPSLHFKHINPAIKLEQSPFFIVDKVSTWQPCAAKKQLAGVSSFGFGGTNSHVVVEEWVENRHANDSFSDINLLTFSAKSKGSLFKMIEQTKQWLEYNMDLSINDICFTRNRYRKHYYYRHACLVSSTKQIKQSFEYEQNVPPGREIRVGFLLVNNPISKGTPYFSVEGIQKFETAIINNKVDLTLINDDTLMSCAYRLLLLKELQQSIKANSFLISENSDLLHCDILIQLDNVNVPAFIDASIIDKMKIISLSNKITVPFQEQLLLLMAKLYVAGVDFAWDRLHPDHSGKLIYLPPYPFEAKSHWLNPMTR